MSNTKVYLDFIEGNLNPAEEQNMVYKFAEDREFLNGFKEFLNVRNVISSNIKSYGPSYTESKELFDKLGYTLPSVIKNPVAAGSHSGNIFNYLVTGTGSAIAGIFLTFSILFPLINKTSPENNYKNESKKLQNELPAKVLFATDIEPEKKFKSSSLKNYPVKILPENVEKNISILQNKDYNFENESPAKIKLQTYPQTLTQNTAQFDANSMQINDNKQVALESSVLNLEIFGLFNWNLQKENISPYSISKFNNLGVSLIYKISDLISIGLAARQETFYLKYKGAEDLNKFSYSQQPNLTSAGITARINPVKMESSKVILQAEIGGNTYGIVTRGMLGYQYIYDKNISFRIGAEYSSFFYNYQGNGFNSSKIGINYGIDFSIY